MEYREKKAPSYFRLRVLYRMGGVWSITPIMNSVISTPALQLYVPYNLRNTWHCTHQNTTDEDPAPTPDDILQITGSQTVAVPGSETVTYRDSTVVVQDNAATVRSFDNIDNFFTYTTVGGTQQLLRFEQNANNPPFFTGGGQLYVDSDRRRAFYTNDAGVITDIEDATVNQTVSIIQTNGMLNLVNNLLVMDNVVIELTGATGQIQLSSPMFKILLMS